ncbi:MAG: hypothetical protein Q8P80_04140 [Candidatus Levybacteria bacterium]|nr:hypothetical protein [Candidatus Levybacteria bacterium]
MPDIEQTTQPSSSGIKGLLIFLLAILVLGSAGTYTLVSRNNNEKNNTNQTVQKTEPVVSKFAPLSQDMIVYGTWSDNSSNIKGFDLSSGKTYILAKLPSNIKKVTILSSDELLYIANTDNNDHGTEIAIYNIKTKQQRTLLKSNQGFGIDDYTISKNKKYIVDWEVSFLEGTNALRGGRSQVYSFELSTPNSKNLVYDEIANTPIHYPRAITDSGNIYFDTFLPNSGAGWAYGMSLSNFNGSQKEDIPNMQNGTYSSQPALSPDDKYLAFLGYDGSIGDGKDLVSGNRKALANPNTVELFDTQTKARFKISTISSKYAELSWDSKTGNLIFQDTKDLQYYSYLPLLKNLNKISPQNNSFRFISSLTNQKMLFGELNDSLSTIGNLGDRYSFSLKKLYVFENPNQQNTLDLSDKLIQIITVVPTNFFSNSIGSFEEENKINVAAEKRTLQLETFIVKSTLAKKRFETQSKNSDPQEISPMPEPESDPCDAACQAYNTKVHDDLCAGNAECLATPLYLYGSTGQKVKVIINTPVFSSFPLYNNGYEVTLLDNGKMEADGKIFERITYDYISAEKITEPEYGTVVLKEELSKVLQNYADNLGLNQKETDDLIEGTKSISSPFVFVSFFDNKNSKEILPIEFNPKPDVYINVVFYLKGLTQVPKELPKEPVFEPLPFRNGFTAVETSWIISY